MMLAMRKHLKKLSIFLWLVIAAFIGTIFLVWGAGKRGVTGGGGDIVGTVNGDEIPRTEYVNARQRYVDYYREVYKDKLTPERLRSLDLDNQVMQDLVRRRLLLQEARRQGVVVTDKEVMDEIESTPYFQDKEGNFRPELYMRVLSMNRIPPEGYEQGIRERKMIERLQNFVRATVRLTDEEVKSKYIEDNEKVNCKYVLFRGMDLSRDLKPSDEELKTLYESQKDNYKSEREVSVEYVKYDPEDYKSAVQLSEDDLLDYYDEHSEDYVQEEEVRARHILIKVRDGADKKQKQEARKKIEDILAKVKAGEDFATLAKEYSECPSSSKGGDLDYFGRGQMAKPFEEAAFSLGVGEVSDIVETQFGFHIIKVEGRKEAESKSLEDVREEIRSKLTEEKALELAENAADVAKEKLEKDKDLAKFAEANGLKAKTTGFFSRTDEIEGIGRSYRFANAALALSEGAISPVVKDRKVFYLMRLVDEKPAIVLPFEEVKDKVQNDWKKNEGEKLAESKASEFAKKATDAASFDELAEKWELEVKETGEFGKTGYVRGVGMNEEFNKMAFAMKIGEIGGPINVRNGFVNFLVTQHKTFDKEQFEREKGKIEKQLREEREEQAFLAWISDLRDKAEIKLDPAFAKAQQAAGANSGR